MFWNLNYRVFMILLNNIIRVENMNKSLFVFMALICSLSAFTIFQNGEAASLQAIPWPFTICGNGAWTIEKLSLASQPVRNANNDIDVLGTATDDTKFSTVDIVVKLNGVFLHSETFEFKKSYDEGDTIEFRYQNFVPSFAPPGTYGISFTFKNGATDNGCMAFNFKL